MIPPRMPAPVRVLAIGNAYPPHHLGGYEIIWRGVTEHLRGEGHSVRVLVTDHRAPHAVPGSADEPDVHRELDWYWRDHRWRSMGPVRRLELERHNAEVFDRHVREFEPDVIAWWPVGGMSLGLIERARRRGLASIFFVLDYWPIYGPRHDLWLRLWSRLRPLAPLAERITGLPAGLDLPAAGRWVFCSHCVEEVILGAHPGIAPTGVIPPGIDREFLAAPGESAPAPWRWRLLYAGRVVEQKGVLTAVQSLAELPDAELRVVGEGDESYRSSLLAAAARLGVGDRLALEPPRPRSELIDVYRWADVVVFPVAWDEPWGLVPLEAMALGRPVAATGRGGSGEYLADGQNAVLFAAGDSSALAGAVRRLARDPALRERLVRAGHRTAAAHSEEGFNRRAAAEILAAARGRSA